eukprot:m.45139 g.45139  ORF g.45139 m.45139 type:complete len:257 (+) comp10654_c1_seq3:2134-2904(+)
MMLTICAATSCLFHRVATVCGSSSPLTRRTLTQSASALSDEKDATATSSSSSKQRKKASVYTRTGDKGTSSLFTGERRSKNDAIFEALGTIDELSSFIGVVIAEAKETPACQFMEPQLIEIQCILQDVASHVATPMSTATQAKLSRTQLPTGLITMLEDWIDELDSDLEPLRNFILPGGGKLSSAIHCARSVCRRAERRVVDVAVAETDNNMDPIAMKTLNRLSDYLFTLARSAAKHTNEHEIIYKKPQLTQDEQE